MLNELPIGIGLIPCDNVIEDFRTRKKSIIGIISKINADSFPFTAQSLNVLISLTGCTEDFPCRLKCVHDETRQEIFNIQCDIKASSVNDVVDVQISFKTLKFPEPGSYTLSVVVEGIPIMFRTIKVVERVRKPVPPREGQSEQ